MWTSFRGRLRQARRRVCRGASPLTNGMHRVCSAAGLLSSSRIKNLESARPCAWKDAVTRLRSLAAMDDSKLELNHAPIVEAVLDIDCDLPPAQDLVTLEASARALLDATYPKHDRQWLQEHRIEANPDASATSFSSRHAAQALRFHQADGKQLVQIRALG